MGGRGVTSNLYLDFKKASLRNFCRGQKQNGHSRHLLNYVLGNIFASKPLRNTISGFTPCFQGQGMNDTKQKLYV